MVRNLLWLFVLVVLAIWGLAWYHTKSVQPISPQSLSLFHWEDATGRATLGAAIRADGFRPVPNRRHNFGYTESIHWFRFRLQPTGRPREFTLDIRNHSLHAVEFATVRNGRLTSLSKTGNWLPFGQRLIPTKTFAFPLLPDARHPTDYYLRLDKRHENLATEINLWLTTDFEDKEQREYLLWGIFAGVVVLVVLLNLIFWVTTTDRVYLWYAVYVTALLLRQLADSGLAFQYLWPNIPALNGPDPIIQAVWLYLPAMFQFQQYFLNLRQANNRLFRATQVMKYVFWVGFLTLIILQLTGISRQYSETAYVIMRVHATLVNVVVILLVWVVVTGFRSGEALKRLYAGGLLIQLVLHFVNIVQNLLRNQPDSYVLIDGYLITIMVFFVDLLVFAYLLAYRYRQSIIETQRLRISLAQTQQETNQKIIDVLESERQHIHDRLLSDVGQRLTEARQLLNGPSSPGPSRQPSGQPLAPGWMARRDTHSLDRLADSVRLIHKVGTDLDRIARNALPVEFAEKGLSASLSELVEQLNGSQSVRFDFTVTGPKSFLSVAEEMHVYRIGTELINNVLKHAQATQTQVTLTCDPDFVSLLVSDNGKGFTASRGGSGGGIGVQNLYARAQDLGADVTIDSGAHGTTISVWIAHKIQTS
ncbi:sensor histidine kinase [Spirosoma arcticum]